MIIIHQVFEKQTGHDGGEMKHMNIDPTERAESARGKETESTK